MNKRSLEDTIRAVSQKHKNKPSPLTLMNQQEPAIAPQQVTANSPPSSKNIRNALTGDFVPPRDTFR